jgi:putative ABC transport system permease protein
MKKLLLYYHLALEALQMRQLRSLLAALGITFGVASVIAMMAVGKGSKQEILLQMRLVGGNSIIVFPQNMEKDNKNTSWAKTSRGLCLQDAQSIRTIFPNISFVSPEINFQVIATAEQRWLQTQLYGIENDYFQMLGIRPEKGSFFSSKNIDNNEAVCVIGASLENKLFGASSALGKYIRCDQQWLKVIGVLQMQPSVSSNVENLGIHNTNLAVYVPIGSVLHRFNHQKFLKVSQGSTHQLGRLVVQVKDADQLLKTAESLQKVLLRLHNNLQDFNILVPEQVVKERQKMQEMLTYLLAAMTGIALLIGGIGIMNVMLTAVMERLKEIGIRKVLGATAQDIRRQFLIEAVMISFLGGMMGVFAGFLLSWLLHITMNMSILLDWSMLGIASLMTIAMGIFFGWYPAHQAARKTPYELLRYE